MERDTTATMISGWAFQLSYQAHLSPAKKSDESTTSYKTHAKRMIDRFLGLLDEAHSNAAKSLNLVSA